MGLMTAAGKSGLLHSAVAGRTDHLRVDVPDGAYVVPADIVSGLGEGNTLAGARVLWHMFEGDAAAPTDLKTAHWENSKVPIMGAGGEFVIAPRAIARKYGELKRGHKILDAWVVHERKKIIAEMKKLPGPVRDGTK